MFNKKNRLTKNKDIERVFKEGKSFYNDVFGFKILENNLNCNRFCIIVSTKVSKKAVVRNKIKRQTRAVLNKRPSLFKKGFDILIITNKNIIKTSFLEVEILIKNCLQKLKIYG